MCVQVRCHVLKAGYTAETGSLTGLDGLSQVRLVIKLQGSFCLQPPTPALELQVHSITYSFPLGSGNETQILMLAKQVPYKLSYPPFPAWIFLPLMCIFHSLALVLV